MKTINLPLINRSFLILLSFYFHSFLTLPVYAANRFVDNGDGTISDTKTGLMWVSKDNGVPINWPDAVEYCKNLRVGGYTDWRMPTIDELEGLYDKSKSGYLPECASSGKVYLTKLIHLTCWFPWASDRKSKGSATYFNFGTRARYRYHPGCPA